MMAYVRPAGAKELIIFILENAFAPAFVTHDHSTQGVALGWLLLAFQADYFRCV